MQKKGVTCALELPKMETNALCSRIAKNENERNPLCPEIAKMERSASRPGIGKNEEE